MKKLRVFTGLLTLLLATAFSARAEWGYPSRDVNLRAGPSMEYPIIARLLAGAPVSVEGCLSDYHWCDVIAGPYRGWVYAGNIVYPYQGTNVPIVTFGAALGIAIVAFSVAEYWDSHYHDRPWYSQRQYWVGRPPAGYGRGYRPPPPVPGFRPGTHVPPPGQGARPRPQLPSSPATGARPGINHPAPPGPRGGAAGNRPPPSQGGAQHPPQDHRPPGK